MRKPRGQPHSQPPMVLVQFPWSQPEVPAAHSSMSWQLCPSPLKPAPRLLMSGYRSAKGTLASIAAQMSGTFTEQKRSTCSKAL